VLEPTSAKRQVNKRAIRVGRQLTRPRSARSAAAQRLKPSARGRLRRELITKELPTFQYAHIFRKDLLITFIVSVSNVGRHHNGKSIGVFAKRETILLLLDFLPSSYLLLLRLRLIPSERTNDLPSFHPSKALVLLFRFPLIYANNPTQETHPTNKKSRDISHPRKKQCRRLLRKERPYIGKNKT
jgi:hypothetical protein